MADSSKQGPGKGAGAGLTYRDAGVDIDAGNELVRRIAPACRATHRPELLNGLGGFASLAELPSGYRQPVLVTGTDGVGTKLKLALEHGMHDGVGQDLVAMCVNDVLVTGAEPFLFLDYYATGALDVDVAERVIKGIARGCELAGCALVGGETAEMPGFYQPGEYDLAGFCVGVVEKSRIVSGAGLAAGQRLIGLASSGPHSNGYSLIRRIIEHTGKVDAQRVAQLLEPTRIYARAVRAVLDAFPVHGMAHVTGGGLTENIPRMLPDDRLAARIDLNAWQMPEVFAWLQQSGSVATAEMLRTFNCGLGFVMATDADQAEAVLGCLRDAGETAFIAGDLVPADTAARDGELILTRD